jgi:hypothetical protein
MPQPQENQDVHEENVKVSRENPIAYTSKHLTETQVKWCTTEKEAYAIIHTVKAFFPYLYGALFTIVTDHAALKYLMSKRESTGRLTRWALYLQQFDMEIKYRPGKMHQNADALSRVPVHLIVSNNLKLTIGSSLNTKIYSAKPSWWNKISLWRREGNSINKTNSKFFPTANARRKNCSTGETT